MSGKFVISLDFEKYWGVRDEIDLSEYKDKLKNVDEVITNLLELFDKYNIHATWATVGFLFHENKKELIKTLPKNTNLYKNEILNPYLYIEKNKLEPTYHFAKKSIHKIINNKNQEIASHTYSHYYCLEDGQDKIDFEKDLELYLSVYNKNKKNKENIKSIVFPRNQVNKDYISILTKYGISAYRGNEDHYIYNASHRTKMSSTIKRGFRLIDRYINISGYNTYELNRNSEIFNVKSSRFLAPYSKKMKWLEPLRKRRIKKAMTYAAKNNEIFHLWWHPHNFSDNNLDNMNFLNDILNHFSYLEKEYNMESNSINDVVERII